MVKDAEANAEEDKKTELVASRNQAKRPDSLRENLLRLRRQTDAAEKEKIEAALK